MKFIITRVPLYSPTHVPQVSSGVVYFSKLYFSYCHMSVTLAMISSCCIARRTTENKVGPDVACLGPLKGALHVKQSENLSSMPARLIGIGERLTGVHWAMAMRGGSGVWCMCSLPTTLQLSPHLHLAFFSDFPLDVNKENAQGVRGKWEMGGVGVHRCQH